MSNSNDDNITVDCADESFRMTLLCGVRKIQKYPALSLLVIAWHDRVEVSHRLAVGRIHQYMQTMMELWTACAAWQAYPNLTETLLTLSDDPTLLTLYSIHMARLERWTVVMYSKSSGCSRVNDVRRQLFTHGTRTLDHIPPHTGSTASTCKASSVPGRLHLETSI